MKSQKRGSRPAMGYKRIGDGIGARKMQPRDAFNQNLIGRRLEPSGGETVVRPSLHASEQLPRASNLPTRPVLRGLRTRWQRLATIRFYAARFHILLRSASAPKLSPKPIYSR